MPASILLSHLSVFFIRTLEKKQDSLISPIHHYFAQNRMIIKLFVFLTKSACSGTKKNKDFTQMEAMLILLTNNWDKFCSWVADQPTFVEMAFGVGLFYLALQVLKAFYKLSVFILSGLISVPGRFEKQNDMRTKPRRKKTVTRDDDSPPFVFR